MEAKERAKRLHAVSAEFDPAFDKIGRACIETLVDKYDLDVLEAAAVFGKVTFRYSVAAMAAATADRQICSNQSFEKDLLDEVENCRKVVMDRLMTRFTADVPV